MASRAWRISYLSSTMNALYSHRAACNRYWVRPPCTRTQYQHSFLIETYNNYNKQTCLNEWSPHGGATVLHIYECNYDLPSTVDAVARRDAPMKHHRSSSETTNDQQRAPFQGWRHPRSQLTACGTTARHNQLSWRHPHRHRSSRNYGNVTTTSSATIVHHTHQLNSSPQYVSSTSCLGLGLGLSLGLGRSRRHERVTAYTLKFCIYFALFCCVCPFLCCWMCLE